MLFSVVLKVVNSQHHAVYNLEADFNVRTKQRLSQKQKIPTFLPGFLINN